MQHSVIIKATRNGGVSRISEWGKASRNSRGG